MAGNVTSFAGNVIFFLAGYHAQGHGLKVLGTFCDTIFTPKEWFLSKKGPKKGEWVAWGHFHERVGETPVHWLPPGVGPTPKPFSVSDIGPFVKIPLGPTQQYSKFLAVHISYFIPISTIALNSSACKRTLFANNEQSTKVFYRSKNAFQLFIGTIIKGKVGKGISSNSLFTLISMPRNAAGGDQLVTGEAPKWEIKK